MEKDTFHIDIISPVNVELPNKVELKISCKNILPISNKELTLLTSETGYGKTWFILQVAIQYVIEHNFKKTAIAWIDEPQGIIHYRLLNIISFLSQENNTNKILQSIEFITLKPIKLIKRTNQHTIFKNDTFQKITKSCSNHNLIIFDLLFDLFMDGDEKNRNDIYKFIQPFKEWAKNEDKTIIFTHSIYKGEKTLFASEFPIVYNLDFIYYKNKIIKDEYRNIELIKNKLFQITDFIKEVKIIHKGKAQ